MINLKVSETEKYKNDGEWFKDYMKHVKPHHTVNTEEYTKMLSLYKIVNLDLTDFKAKVEQFCNPLADILEVETDTLIATPEIKTKIQTLVGEIIKRNENLKLRLTSSHALREKNEQLINEIQQSIDEKLGLELLSLQEQMQGLSP